MTDTLTDLIARQAAAAVKPDSLEELRRLAELAQASGRHLIDTAMGQAEYERAMAELHDYLSPERILRMIPALAS